MISPSVVAKLDQLEAHAREFFPDRSSAWREIYVLRLVHYATHGGDMSGAPAFPDEER